VPKRVLDGEALWLSDKLRKLSEKIRPEFANLIPLALANGSFECDPRKIWSRVYSYNRPDVTVQFVEQMLDEFESAKILFRWKDGHGVTWGYWIGIDKPGRLPSGTDQKHGAKGATVPQDALKSFLSDLVATSPVNEESAASHIPVSDRSGFGSGSGSGLGSGDGTGSCSGVGSGKGSGPGLGKGSSKGVHPQEVSSSSADSEKAGPSPTTVSVKEAIRKAAQRMSAGEGGTSPENRQTLLAKQGEEMTRRFPGKAR
jgi:hypothetical protein